MTDSQGRRVDGSAVAPTDDTGYCPECGRAWQGTPLGGGPQAGTIARCTGECLLALVCLLVPALSLDLVALQLSRGAPLTREALGRAADEALVVIARST